MALQLVRVTTAPENGARRALARLWRFGWCCFDRTVQRRALAGLTDQELLDIGVSRRAARQEAAKPFWQA
ncbi:MAG TPA: hypothetical protein VNS22_20215 [Geminicoccus sp.]|uniref:DUF1127 domain-containing protein n=1 Tax=Geminicoccus sp. TaxID=2024832 RepID=UPI002B5F1E2F|nr:hypothetical protein [Geminicoccus sp.]HWL70682.1 hypothetical protein [Geminicoccus sp.]